MFVGTVVGLENDNRWVKVLVEERWQNADGLPDTVDVRGGPEAGIRTLTDRVLHGGPLPVRRHQPRAVLRGHALQRHDALDRRPRALPAVERGGGAGLVVRVAAGRA